MKKILQKLKEWSLFLQKAEVEVLDTLETSRKIGKGLLVVIILRAVVEVLLIAAAIKYLFS